jgi:hypothetical protein
MHAQIGFWEDGVELVQDLAHGEDLCFRLFSGS